MRILQLCKKFPYPLKDGEAIAVTYLSKALNDLNCEVTLLAMNTHKHYCDTNDLPIEFNHYRGMHFAKVDNRIKPLAAFLNLFSKESYHIARFISDEFSETLIKLLSTNTFDVIQLETLYLAPYIPIIRKHSKAKIAMRAHNVEHEIWQRITDNTTFFPKKQYLQHLTNKLRNFEINALKDYDLLIPITKRDLQTYRKMGYKGKSIVTPIGLDGSDYTADFSSFEKPMSLSFIGSLDWMPNQEGLDWFLEKVWGKTQEILPNLELHIAGRNTPDRMMRMKTPNVTVHGEVPSASDFINQHSVMIVPLLSGSGMRAKILEGMALGKVVITTSLGLEGIDARNGEEVLIADTPEKFVEAIEYCHRYHEKLKTMGQLAQEFILTEYDNLSTARRLAEQYAKPVLIKN